MWDAVLAGCGIFKIARNTVVEILFSFNQIYKRRSTQLLNIDQK